MINMFKADIFSLGCVLYEFLNHANHAFYSVEDMLNAKMPDMEVIPRKYRNLLLKMLSPDPQDRPLIQNILTDDSGLVVFPRLFCSYMTSYLALLPINSPRSPQRKDPFDSTISRLFKDSDDLVNIFDDPSILLILLQIITLCMQRCRKEELRLTAFKILDKFSIDNPIWSRIFPEVQCLISDRSSPLVRVCVINFTGKILHLLDGTVIKNIIIPLFKDLMINDMSDLVRLNISQFLSNFHNEEFTQLILMEESNVDVRVAFINNLKNPGSTEIPLVVTQLNEPNYEIRIAALKFLQKHLKEIQKNILPILIHSFHRRNHIDVYMIILDMILEIIKNMDLKEKRILDLIEKTSPCIYHPIMHLKAKEIINILQNKYPNYSYFETDDSCEPLSTGLYEIILRQGLTASQFVGSFIKEQSDPENIYTDSYKLQILSKIIILEAEWLGKHLESSRKQDFKYSRRKWPIKSLQSIDSVASFISNSNNNSSNPSLGKLKLDTEIEHWHPYGRIITSIKIPSNDANCLESFDRFWISGHDLGLLNLWLLDFKMFSSDRMEPMLSYKIPTEQNIIELSCDENENEGEREREREEDWHRIIILTQKYCIYIVRIFLDSMIRHIEVEASFPSFNERPIYYKWSQRGILIILSSEIRMYNHSNDKDDGNPSLLLWKLTIKESIYCAHTPDNTILVIGTENGRILVYDLRFALLVFEFKVHDDCIYDLKAKLTRETLNERKYLLHIYYQISDNVHIWDVESNRIISSLKEGNTDDSGHLINHLSNGMNGISGNENESGNVIENGFAPIAPYQFMTVLLGGDVILAKANGQLKYWNPKKNTVQESLFSDSLSGSTCLGMVVLNRQELVLILLSGQRLLILK